MVHMVSVWLPAWPIERVKRENKDKLFSDDRPFALVGTEERGLVLTALNAAALGAGLYPSLGLADARAICPHLLTAPADPNRDSESLLALARWSSRYSPSLNVDGRDGLWLDVAGIAHLFDGERALLTNIAKGFARLGFSARLALAESLGGAHALARFARSSPIIVPAGKLGEALALLPIEGLRLAEETTRLLKRLGLKRIGQLYDLPRSSLERRFHSREAAEAVLNRLDQALGRREEPCPPLCPAPEYAAMLPFTEPLTTHEGIVSGLDHLARRLGAALAHARRGARRITLAIYRADGSSAVIEAGLSAPVRAPGHLSRILQDRMGAIDVGFGVDSMILAALCTEPLLPAQTSFAKSEDRGQQGPLIDRLANRLRQGAVRRLLPRESHLPERAQAMRSALAGASFWPEPGTSKPPRPILLLARPEPLDVLAEVPEGPPARFTWRRVTRRVVKAEGPERMEPEWWRELVHPDPTDSITSPLEGEVDQPLADREGSKPTQSLPITPLPNPPPQGGRGNRGSPGSKPRDYYRIEDNEGHRYWVFRQGLYQDSADGTPSWYLHGVFG